MNAIKYLLCAGICFAQVVPTAAAEKSPREQLQERVDSCNKSIGGFVSPDSLGNAGCLFLSLELISGLIHFYNIAPSITRPTRIISGTICISAGIISLSWRILRDRELKKIKAMAATLGYRIIGGWSCPGLTIVAA